MSIERQYIGNMDQMFNVKTYRYEGGKADGVKAVDIHNGGNLQYTVICDRGLDLYQVRYKNINMNYITPAGIVAPQYYNDKGTKWLDSFFGGFLTTCGLSNIGVPSNDNGTELSLHGKMNNTPAKNLCVDLNEGVNPYVEIKGKVQEASFGGQKLELNRKIRCDYQRDCIELYDEIRNIGFKTEPYMILYHMNMGYPFLDEHVKLYIPTEKVWGRDAYSQRHIDEWGIITKPKTGFQEMCFYHQLKSDESNRTRVGVFNPKLNIGIIIDFDINVLNCFVEWRMLGAGEYVVGLEPANSTLDGREKAREQGMLKELKSGQSIQHVMKIYFTDSQENVAKKCKIE